MVLDREEWVMEVLGRGLIKSIMPPKVAFKLVRARQCIHFGKIHHPFSFNWYLVLALHPSK